MLFHTGLAVCWAYLQRSYFQTRQVDIYMNRPPTFKQKTTAFSLALQPAAILLCDIVCTLASSITVFRHGGCKLPTIFGSFQTNPDK